MSLRDERLSNIREMMRKSARLVSFVFSRKALRRFDDDFRRVFIRARCLKELDECGKRSPSVLSLALVTSLTLLLSLSVTQTTTKHCLCFVRVFDDSYVYYDIK